MNKTKIKEKNKTAQNCKNIDNNSIANVVGADLVSAHAKTTNNKLNANVVGAGLVSAHKQKNASNKLTANVVGVAPLGDPLFEEHAKNSSKEPNYGRTGSSAPTKSRYPKPNSLYKGTLKSNL